MIVGSNDLPQQLASELRSLYVVTGDALLLSIEASDLIRNKARASGFSERDTLTAEQHFNWSELRAAAQSLSLFATNRIIDLRIPSGKPGVEGGQALQDYCANLNKDLLTIISLPKLDKAAQNSKWYQALQKSGVIVTADDIPRISLPNWIAARLKRQQQSADKLTLEFLADRCEGNLLAAFQEIQKLGLLYPAGELSFEQVKDAVMDVSRFDIFKLTEAMLSGDSARYVRILDGLRAEGTATVLILWAISEEVRTLGQVLHTMQLGSNLANALREVRVWGSRLGSIESAVRRLNLGQIEGALLQAARLDKIIKGLRQGDVWDEFLQLGLRFSK
ncbi:MAG: DNA polymerase III subunit delta [Gallionella sp.]